MAIWRSSIPSFPYGMAVPLYHSEWERGRYCMPHWPRRKRKYAIHREERRGYRNCFRTQTHNGILYAGSHEAKPSQVQRHGMGDKASLVPLPPPSICKGTHKLCLYCVLGDFLCGKSCTNFIYCISRSYSTRSIVYSILDIWHGLQLSMGCKDSGQKWPYNIP